MVFVDFWGGEALDDVELWLGDANGRPPEIVLGAEGGRTPVFVAGGAIGIEVMMVWNPPVDADIVTVETDSDGFAEASGALVVWELCVAFSDVDWETGSPTMLVGSLSELKIGVFGSTIVVAEALQVVEPSSFAVWTY